MTPAVQEKIKEYVKKFLPHVTNVVEVGSLDLNGGVRHCLGEVSDYVGIDRERGPGVDIVADFHEANKLFEYEPDVILCLNTLEHDPMPWLTVSAMRDMLQPGGYLIISTPINGGTAYKHGKDYFRFMPDAYTDWFFDGYDVLDLCQVSYQGIGTICGIAHKPYRIKHDTKNNS